MSPLVLCCWVLWFYVSFDYLEVQEALSIKAMSSEKALMKINYPSIPTQYSRGAKITLIKVRLLMAFRRLELFVPKSQVITVVNGLLTVFCLQCVETRSPEADTV